MMFVVWFLAAVGALSIISGVALAIGWAWMLRSLPAPKSKPRGKVVHVDAASWRQHGGRDDVRN